MDSIYPKVIKNPIIIKKYLIGITEFQTPKQNLKIYQKMKIKILIIKKYLIL